MMAAELRKYNESDLETLISLLNEEGANGEKEDFSGNKTFILEEERGVIGFFTYRVERHGYPHLLHFLIAKKYRGNVWPLRLIKMFKEMIREEGHEKYIIHGPKKRRKEAAIVAWYAKVPPYDETVRHRFYLLGVTA